MRSIITIIGARPQFIKAAVVSHALLEKNLVKEIILHTGQHFDTGMSEVFFSQLDIPTPKYNLGIGGGTHGQNTGRMIEKIEEVLIAEEPNAVLVYGDTDSTLAGAIASVKLHIPLLHVEAGLRSFNRQMPEEINRVLTDHASDLLFAPTSGAVDQLQREGFSNDKIVLSGDVMYDATLAFSKQAELYYSQELEELVGEPFALLTLHRAENVDNREKLSNILEAIGTSHLRCIFPVHPRTRKRIDDFGLELPVNTIAIAPTGYLDMLYLEKRAYLILTDSGGVQKEAFFNKKPCITLRNETEWRELEEIGVNQVVGSEPGAICAAIDRALQIPVWAFSHDLYGSGNAASIIVKSLLQYLYR